ncbi:unnamed protein product [Adineta ricciae]|nr:unnamed protein product [Adineta ricciae]
MSHPEPKTNADKNHDDVDEDDEQLHILYQIVPTMYNTTTQEPHTKDVKSTVESTTITTTQVIEPTDINVDIEYLLKKDPIKYIYTPSPKDYSGFVHCTVHCHKEGLLSKTFALYFNGRNDNDQTFLLTARKHIKLGGHSEYLIGNDEKSAKDITNENAIARLKCMNIIDTEYILYDQMNQQSLAIIYNTYIIGTNEPRKLTVLMHDAETASQPLKENETIINEWRAGRANNWTEIKNVAPIYDNESKKYNLPYIENRVQQMSHKNFQLAHQGNVIMQFGRIDYKTYALDYRYPLTAMQAFAIALSAFHNRFRN